MEDHWQLMWDRVAEKEQAESRGGAILVCSNLILRRGLEPMF